jgi:hypothetical protein
MSAAGFHVSDVLDCARMSAAGLSRRLDRLGFLAGDVAVIEAGDHSRVFQLGG